MRPRLLDLYCGAGGCSAGYYHAGFQITGVDIDPQPNYPFRFIQADALTVDLDGYDAIHASPPCHAYSTVGKQVRALGRRVDPYPDLVAPTRERLRASGLPYVIENVMGAPLENPIMLCGSSFGLNVRRHRLFEIHGFSVMAQPCAHHWQTPRFRSLDKRRNGNSAAVVGVHGHINYSGEREIREWAMDVDWMTPHELAQAIPPPYTEHIGRYLMGTIREPVARVAFDEER